MTRFAALLLVGMALQSLSVAAHDAKEPAPAAAGETKTQVVSQGPTLMLTRDDGIAYATGQKALCSSDVLEVFFHEGRFALEGGLLDAAELVESVKQRKTKKTIGCVRVSGPYDRAAFDALGNALVDPVGVSLVWPRPTP